MNEKNLVTQEQDSINKTFLSDYLKENTELKVIGYTELTSIKITKPIVF